MSVSLLPHLVLGIYSSEETLTGQNYNTSRCTEHLLYFNMCHVILPEAPHKNLESSKIFFLNNLTD